jgi:ribosomal-protein-alanine acetyltransferase
MIRAMEPGDAEAIQGVWAACLGASHWSARELLQLSKNGARIWVAFEEGCVIGAVAARVAGDEAEILNLGVAPSWRKRGVGRELMAAAVGDANRRGATRVFLEVRESNAGARAFYRGLGFEEVGRRRAYYRDPAEDALVLALPVRASQP